MEVTDSTDSQPDTLTDDYLKRQSKVLPTSPHLKEGNWTAEVWPNPHSRAPKANLKISIELPLEELGIFSQHARTIEDNTRPLSSSKNRSTFPFSGTHSVPYRRESRRQMLPHTYRSTLYQSVSGSVDLNKDLNGERAIDDNESKSYLAAMTDLDKMLEGQVDWQRVEDIEKTIWAAQTDPNCPQFVRQGSISSYIRILVKAIQQCKQRAEELKHLANQFYAEYHLEMQGIQIQQLAHFRLLMADTMNEIHIVEKNLSTSKTFVAGHMMEGGKHQRRFPLMTPKFLRECYAKQVRVVTEMLALMEELLNKVKHADGVPLKLIPDQ